MAHSIAQRKVKKTSRGLASLRPDFAERRIRQVSAWIVLFLAMEGELGLAWDRSWHDRLGRDQFWIPPHIMMYTAVAGIGLTALVVVLVDTLRYYQMQVGVDDSSTVGVLRFFHAPFGFVLMGFGALTDLIAAPLDNYWHLLYGIDATLWTPFHLMGAIGAVILGLGSVYAFASEAAHERQSGYPSRRFAGLTGPEWGFVIFIGGFMEFVLPALTAFIPILLDPVKILTYPLILVLASSVCLVSVYLCIRKPGITLLAVAVVCLLSVVTETYIPFALRFMAARLELTFRVGRPPIFNIILALLPLAYLFCALMVEAVAYWQRRTGNAEQEPLRRVWLVGALMAIPAVMMPPAIAYAINVLAPSIPLSFDVVLVLEPSWLNKLISLPLAMLVGATMAFVGTVFGDIWHWNKQ